MEDIDGRFATVETWPDEAIVKAIAEGQAAAVAAVGAALDPLAAGGRLMADTWRKGGKLAYAGAGSSGLMAATDALELPGTYGLDPARLPIILAGGTAAFSFLDYGSEDDEAEAARAVAEAKLDADDLMVAVSASGSTPFTLSAARTARAAGASVIAIAGQPSTPLLDLANVRICVATGPEIVAGSTRMNAGTAQKCALNMLSTLMAMRLHHVHGGMMVNLHAGNDKLRRRARRIVARAADVDDRAAAKALEAADGQVKLAILTAKGMLLDEARQRLAHSQGDLRAALGARDS